MALQEQSEGRVDIGIADAFYMIGCTKDAQAELKRFMNYGRKFEADCWR